MNATRKCPCFISVCSTYRTPSWAFHYKMKIILIVMVLLNFVLQLNTSPVPLQAEGDSPIRVKRQFYGGRLWGAPKNSLAFMPVSIWGRKKRSIETARPSSDSEVVRQKRRVYNFYGGNGQPIGAFTDWGSPYNPNTFMAVSSWGR